MAESTYFRAKQATRAKSATGKLDTDGFEKWADMEQKPEGFTPPGFQRGYEKMAGEDTMSGGRRHKHHGGALKDDIESAINIWNNVKISGKPLKDWSLIPTAVKTFVEKLISVFDVIKANAPQLKEALEKYGDGTGPGAAQAKAVLGVIKNAGFGKPDFKKLAKHGEKAEELMHEARGEEGVHFMRGLHKLGSLSAKGGDAFTDKLTSLSSAAPAALASVESAYPAIKGPVDGVRKAYNFYDQVKKASPAVKSALEQYAPAIAAKINPALEKVGLGRRRKHKGGAGLDDDQEQILGIHASRYGVKQSKGDHYREFQAEGGAAGDVERLIKERETKRKEEQIERTMKVRGLTREQAIKYSGNGAGQVERLMKEHGMTRAQAIKYLDDKTEKQGRGASSWISHVKQYAKEHGIKYGEALSKASATWKK